MPLGLWRFNATRDHIARGEVVVACLPPDAVQHRYLGPGSCPTGFEPVLKPVAAVAGDVVEASGAGIRVNGALLPETAPMALDAAGRPLPHVTGTSTVAPGSIWLVAPRRISFDSRYFGAVHLDQIQGRASPLAVWR